MTFGSTRAPSISGLGCESARPAAHRDTTSASRARPTGARLMRESRARRDLDYDDGAADVHLVAGGELQAIAAGRHLDQAAAAAHHGPVRALLVEDAVGAGGRNPGDVGVCP